ncbi:hypothetical protein BaRGS_00022845, partial [Batillaria attramentaria]
TVVRSRDTPQPRSLNSSSSRRSGATLARRNARGHTARGDNPATGEATWNEGGAVPRD